MILSNPKEQQKKSCPHNDLTLAFHNFSENYFYANKLRGAAISQRYTYLSSRGSQADGVVLEVPHFISSVHKSTKDFGLIPLHMMLQ